MRNSSIQRLLGGARSSIACTASITALAIAALQPGPASAGTYNFIGSSSTVPGYGAHYPDSCLCGNSPGDTYDYTLSGNLFDPGAYAIAGQSGGLPAPGPNDLIVAFGDVPGDNPPVMGPGGSLTIDAGLYTIPVYGQIGPGFTGSGLNATGSGSVEALAIGGNGSLHGSTITAKDYIEILNGAPVAKYAQAYNSGTPTFLGYAPSTFTVSGSKLDGGAQMIIENGSSDPSYPSTLTISGSSLSADTMNFYGPGQGEITIGASSSVDAITTNLYVDNPNPGLGSALSLTDVVLQNSTMATGSLNIGVTNSGNPPIDASSALLEIDGGSAEIAQTTIVGVEAPGGIDVYNDGELDTDGNTFLGIFAAATGSEVDVHDGGTWNSEGQIYIGGNTASTVKVTDTGTLTSSDLIAVGLNAGSDGTLDIEDGGTVASDAKAGPGTLSGTVGPNTGSMGLVTIEGDGSTWENKQSLSIGTSGDGAVDVGDGGLLKVDGLQLRIGRNEGSNGLLNVSGDGSMVDVSSGTIYVGNGGNGEADFSDGGSITAMATSIGELDTGVGVMTFDGAGGDSDLGDTIVGNAGDGDLQLAGGATVKVGKLTVAAQEDSLGSVELEGSGTTLTIDDDASIGESSTGELDVTNGARVNANKVTIGEEDGGVGAIGVDNSGSLLDARDDLTVGGAGRALLDISDGGRVTADAKLTVGEADGGDGTVHLSGTDSSLTVHDETVIGKAGSGTLDLEDGATFTGDTVTAGADVGGEGVISVAGSATLQTGDLTIGGNGLGTLDLADGQVITAGEGKIADGEDGDDGTPGGGGGGEVTLSDAQALWQNDALTVGGNGDGTLTVSAGTVATGGDATIADEEGSSGKADLDGNTAVWTIGGGLTVGGKGDGSLTIENGATVSIAGSEFKIGDEEGGTGLVTLDGKDSSLIFATGSGSGEITVGGGGMGTLALQDGATMTTYAVTLGDEASGSGVLALTGEGTQLTVNHDLTIGGKGFGDLELQQKAVLLADGDVKFSDEVSGGGMGTIDSGGQLAVGGTLSIGAKAAGSLTVKDGSLVSALGDDVELGENVGGIGVLTLTGKDGGVASTLAAAGEIKVGDGGAGEIDIDDGAALKPTATGKGLIAIGVQAGSDGTVTVDGAGSSLTANEAAVGGTMEGVGGSGQMRFTNGSTGAISATLDMWPAGLVLVDAKSSVLVGSGTANIGAVTVGAGGTLEGTGTIDADVINSGGTVHPGHSPGTLVVNGNYIQTSGGTLLLSVGPTSYSQLVVNGTALLNGGTIVLQDYQGGHVSLGEDFTFIDASGGITGKVDTIVTSDPFLSLSPDIQGGVLTLTAVHTAGSFAATAVTPNQKAVAHSLDAAAMNNASPIVPLVEAISNLAPGAMPAAFDALSPEGLVAVENAGFSEQRAFDSTVSDAAAVPGSAGDTGGTTATVSGRWRFWVSGFGNRADFGTSSARALSGETTTDGGFAAGMDYRLAEPLLVGIATGYSTAHYSASARATSGNTDNAHLAAYAALSAGAFYANALVGYDWADDESNRSTSVAGFGGTLHGSGRNTIASGRIEAGWRWTTGNVSLTPFISGDILRFRQQRFTELSTSGNVDALALTIPHQHIDSGTINAGVRAEARLSMGSTTIIPDLQFSYDRQMDTGRHLDAAFVSAPDAIFAVNGISPGRNYGHAGVGMSAILTPSLRLSVRVATDRAKDDHQDSAQGGITWSW